MAPGIDHLADRSRQSPWIAESPGQQGPGAGCRSEIARIEEARVEGWYGEEGSHEFARFVFPTFPFCSRGC